jgi:flagellar biosynthesis protein FlhB
MSQGGDKTEKPTEKRLRDARRKGQVAKSQDLTSSLLFISSIAVLSIAATYIGSQLSTLMRDGIFRAATFKGELDRSTALSAMVSGVESMAWTIAPLLIVLFLIALFANYLQVGSIFAFESLKPDLKKLNPAEGFKQKFFKSRPYIELLKTIIKMVVAAVVVGLVLWDARVDMVRLSQQSLSNVLWYTSHLAFEIGIKVGLAYLFLGAADLFLQRFLYLNEMKMTKQEVKQEYKEMEGDPLLKSMRRHLHREILSQNMVAAVKTADVVVVNPTHVAVALKYDKSEMEAPTVVAKGAELMAAQIRELAKEYKIPIMRDVPLARSLYDLEIDAEIPDELYEAVATVLRWVYQLAEERGEVISHG